MSLLNPSDLIESGGILLIAGIVFAESGLLAGFFLPGDTLLLSAGFFAAQGKFSLPLLLIAVVLAAIIGDNVGYSIGRRTGPRVFKKSDGLFFRKEYVEQAERFYEKHGGKTIILARFIPIIRTFALLVAGIGKMPRKRFIAYNIIGGVLWGAGVTMLGYFLGDLVEPEVIEKYFLPLMILVVSITFVPAVYHLLKEKETRHLLWQKIKLGIRNIFLNKKID